MNKKTVFKEVNKEIKKLNDSIDKKILKGRSYKKEALRHRELLVIMRSISRGERLSKLITKRRSLSGKSPVRKSLKKGVMSRIFTRKFAY